EESEPAGGLGRDTDDGARRQHDDTTGHWPDRARLRCTVVGDREQDSEGEKRAPHVESVARKAGRSCTPICPVLACPRRSGTPGDPGRLSPPTSIDVRDQPLIYSDCRAGRQSL